MPSTIPYDPSLILANVVSGEAIAVVEQISALQAVPDAAQETLNSLLSMRRSFDMTKTELLNLGIETKDLEDESTDLNTQIESAAKTYAKARIDAEKGIQPLRAKIQAVHANVESPVDYIKTEIKTMPLSTDSLNMDVQFFSLDENTQTSQSFASQISSYVAASVSWMGNEAASQISAASAKQVSQQVQNHSIAGTLVFSVSCTHRNAQILAPFALNVDKGIKVWNKLFPSDKVVPTNTAAMIALAAADDPDGTNAFSIISGMTYGSSFVGMVHVLNSSDTSASETLTSVASSLQAQVDAGCWLERESGGFGLNASFGSDIKNLLSTQNITSHVTLISMGVIPSIVASDVKAGVKEFASFDPKTSMDAIQTINSSVVTDQTSVKSSADAARTGQQMISLQGGAIKSALSALSDIEKTTNKMLDINSLMTALDDYLKKAQTGDGGVPINYYLKQITRSMLAEMWVAKYIPGRYMSIGYDDVAPSGPASGAGTTTTAPATPSSPPS